MCMLPLLIAFHLDSISGDNCSVHYQLLSSVTLFHFLCQLCEQQLTICMTCCVTMSM